jgi:hypothetical protein
MAQRTRKAAAPSKGAAARAEKTGAPKTIDFRGLELALPDVLPGTVYFDLAALEENEGSAVAQVRLLRSLIGGDQLAAVRDKIGEDQVPLDKVDEVVIGLFNDIVGAYGSTEGESAASPAS